MTRSMPGDRHGFAIPRINHWRAVCSESCKHGSEGGSWKRTLPVTRQRAHEIRHKTNLARSLPYDESHGRRNTLNRGPAPDGPSVGPFPEFGRVSKNRVEFLKVVQRSADRGPLSDP